MFLVAEENMRRLLLLKMLIIKGRVCVCECVPRRFISPAARRNPVEVPLSRIIVTRFRGRYDAEIIQSTLARFFLSVNFQCLQIQLLPEACDLCFPRPGSLFDLSGAQPSPSRNRRHPIRPHLPSHVSLQRCVFTSGATRAVMS